MNRKLTMTDEKQFITNSFVQVTKRLLMFGMLALAIAVPAIAQNPEIQEKLAAVKQAAAENKQKIRQYQWIETTQLTLKGDAKPRRKIVACTARTVKSKRP
jgi:hypothetical protein